MKELAKLLAALLVSFNRDWSPDNLHKLEMWLHEHKIYGISIYYRNNSDMCSFQAMQYGGVIRLGQYYRFEFAEQWVHSVAHEIRHAWQNQYQPDLMTDYEKVMLGGFLMDLNEHEKHPAEQDANAFADLVWTEYQKLNRKEV